MSSVELLPGATAEPAALIASPWHTALVVLIEALNSYRGAVMAAHSRAGFGPSRPVMYLRTMLFEFLFLAVVAAGVRWHGTSLTTILGRKWRSMGEAMRDFGLGVGILFASIVVVSILSGHQHGAPEGNIGFLLPRNELEMALWIALSITAGICEEAIYRGYFQRQFAGLTRSAAAGIFISAAAFGAAHAYQGWARATVIAVSALLLGAAAQWRGTVRPGMFAHALQDGIAPLLIRLMRR